MDAPRCAIGVALLYECVVVVLYPREVVSQLG